MLIFYSQLLLSSLPVISRFSFPFFFTFPDFPFLYLCFPCSFHSSLFLSSYSSSFPVYFSILLYFSSFAIYLFIPLCFFISHFSSHSSFSFFFPFIFVSYSSSHSSLFSFLSLFLCFACNFTFLFTAIYLPFLFVSHLSPIPLSHL